MRWVNNPLRQRFDKLKARSSGVRGNVDGIDGGCLVGWVQLIKQPAKHVAVGLYVRGALLAESVANVYRGDLEAGGIGNGHHGFIFPLGHAFQTMVASNGGIADVKVIGVDGAIGVKLGSWAAVDMPTAPAPTDGTPSIVQDTVLLTGTDLEKELYSDVKRLSDALDAPPSTVPTRAPLPENHAKLFARTDYLDPDAELPKEMYGYTEYIRYRDRLDEKFDTANTPDDIAHFYKRYLSLYSGMRGGLRVPLSKDALAYLNEPVIFGGCVGSFSRIMWTMALDTPAFVQTINIKDEDWYGWAVYWWAKVQAKSLHCEDCLVPDYMIAQLRSVPVDMQDQPFPITDYMRRIVLEVSAFAKYDVTTLEGRRDLTCAFVLRSVSRPETLRYLPVGTLDAIFAEENGSPILATFAKALDPKFAMLTRARFAHALRHSSFDIDTMEALFFTAEGHRLEQAGLPRVELSEDRVDVQVIGPFKKASGLGQAVRLSAEMLAMTGLTVNKVDFGLDNPAPEGFSRSEAVSNYKSSKVNIIHLNAEAIPLAYSYQPDAFTDSYNIGYFFWELDSPGACHYLGMNMLDEIWVSTEFGVSIFEPHVDIPVTNVGMSFEDLPDIERGDARTFLQKTANVGADDFVFMVTFDSFSFVQRKNPIGVLKAFEKAFPRNDPAHKSIKLVIKTQNRTKVGDPEQIRIWNDIDAMLKLDGRIVLINETLPYQDLLRLKKGSDAYISLHRSEGWGFGVIEAMRLEVPVLTTGYSGNLDFCDPETCWLVNYDEIGLKPNDYIFVRPGQFWADPDLDDAAEQMRDLRDNPKEREKRAKAASFKIETEFSPDAIGERYGSRMQVILASLEKQRT